MLEYVLRYSAVWFSRAVYFWVVRHAHDLWIVLQFKLRDQLTESAGGPFVSTTSFTDTGFSMSYYDLVRRTFTAPFNGFSGGIIV